MKIINTFVAHTRGVSAVHYYCLLFLFVIQCK